MKRRNTMLACNISQDSMEYLLKWCQAVGINKRFKGVLVETLIQNTKTHYKSRYLEIHRGFKKIRVEQKNENRNQTEF